jgi:hypothetical protein
MAKTLAEALSMTGARPMSGLSLKLALVLAVAAFLARVLSTIAVASFPS